VSTPGSAPPQFSPDRQWWWNGQQWVPAAQGTHAMPADAAAAWGAPFADATPGLGLPGYAIPTGYAIPSGYNAPGTDGKAVASLVLAIVWLGGLGSIAAVILGHLSRSESRRLGRQPSGLALAGLIIGYLGLALVLLFVTSAIAIPVFLAQSDKGHVVAVKTTLRKAAIAEEMFGVDNEEYTNSESVLVLNGFQPENGVTLVIVSASSNDYCLTASYRDSNRRYYYDSHTPSVITVTPCG
jgi:Tfp pilus assembly protein PilE